MIWKLLQLKICLFFCSVEIGSLLYFNSQVAYTEGNHIQVRVGAEALNPNTKELEAHPLTFESLALKHKIVVIQN